MATLTASAAGAAAEGAAAEGAAQHDAHKDDVIDADFKEVSGDDKKKS